MYAVTFTIRDYLERTACVVTRQGEYGAGRLESAERVWRVSRAVAGQSNAVHAGLEAAELNRPIGIQIRGGTSLWIADTAAPLRTGAN